MTSTEILRRCQYRFDETGHDETWRNRVAADLNQIVARVQWTMECSIPLLTCDQLFAEAALRLVERVVEFEEIKVK